jgi:DNA-binding NarL/FixJ family response regulator
MSECLLNTPVPLAAANHAASAYTIVVAHDSYLIGAGIEAALADEEQVEVARYCHDLPSLLAGVEEHSADVVITGIRLAPSHNGEGIDAAVTLRKTHPDVGVVVLSHDIEPRHALALFAPGIDRRAYLHVDHVRPSQLMDAVREVAGGGSMIDPRVVGLLVEARLRAKSSQLNQLTTRERDVLAGIAAGKANAAIADSLFLTKRAVEKKINAIFSKLNLDDEAMVSRRVVAARLFLTDSELSPRDVG